MEMQVPDAPICPQILMVGLIRSRHTTSLLLCSGKWYLQRSTSNLRGQERARSPWRACMIAQTAAGERLCAGAVKGEPTRLRSMGRRRVLAVGGESVRGRRTAPCTAAVRGKVCATEEDGSPRLPASVGATAVGGSHRGGGRRGCAVADLRRCR